MQHRQQNSEPTLEVAAATPGAMAPDASQGPVAERWLPALADNAALLPSLIRKPRLVGLWLASARRAQIALGLALLVLVFIAPPTLTAVSLSLIHI